MTFKTRQELAKWANAVGQSSNRPTPAPVKASSTLTEVCRWLQWNDPNGEHLNHLEPGFDPDFDPGHDLESAWDTIEEWAGDY